MAGVPSYKRIIVWFRRALRVDDHPALWHAMRDTSSVVPLLCISDDPSYNDLTHRRRFMRGAIADLDRSLRHAGTMLHLRIGDPTKELPAAARAYGADAVYAVDLSDPASVARDARIVEALASIGVQFLRFPDRVLRGDSKGC